MSFIKRAQEAAEAAESRSRRPPTAGDADGQRSRHDRAHQQRACRARASARARRSAWPAAASTTVIERIDPATLAELIIKATALQEMTNKRAAPEGLALPDLRDLDLGVDPAGRDLRHRPHRRHRRTGRRRRSTSRPQLVEADATRPASVVIALDGTTIDEATARHTSGRGHPGPEDEAMPPSAVSRSE